jgi:drug/metabolite transporter (DMT)-like permease
MLLVVIVASVAINAGYVVQHSGLVSAPPIDMRRPIAAVGALVRSRRWLAGAALGYAGLALELIALTSLPLSIVQAMIGGGLVVVAALARAPAGRAAPVGAVLAVNALVVLAVVSPRGHPHAPAAGALAAAAALAIAAAALVARRRLALAAGLLYGVTSLASAVLAPLFAGAARSPALVAVALVAGVPATGGGFLCFQRALQHGRPLAVVTAMMAAMDVVAIAGGLVVLGDPLAAGTAARAAQVSALALAGLSALVITGEPPAAQEPPRLGGGRDAEGGSGVGRACPRPGVRAADEPQVNDRGAAAAGRPVEAHDVR